MWQPTLHPEILSQYLDDQLDDQRMDINAQANHATAKTLPEEFKTMILDHQRMDTDG